MFTGVCYRLSNLYTTGEDCDMRYYVQFVTWYLWLKNKSYIGDINQTDGLMIFLTFKGKILLPKKQQPMHWTFARWKWIIEINGSPLNWNRIQNCALNWSKLDTYLSCIHISQQKHLSWTYRVWFFKSIFDLFFDTNNITILLALWYLLLLEEVY